MTASKNADLEAWLADQLAQLPQQLQNNSPMVTHIIELLLEPGSETFHAVEKIAQEYGEMCAARATADFEDLTIVTKDEGGLHVLVGGNEIKPLDEIFPSGGYRDAGDGCRPAGRGLRTRRGRNGPMSLLTAFGQPPQRCYPEPPFTLDVEWLHLFDEWVDEIGDVNSAQVRAANVFDHAFAKRLRMWWEVSP